MTLIRSLLAGLLLCAALAGCSQEPTRPGDSLDAIARDYVLLSLTIGEKEEGYIDAYYGPPELQEQAKADASKAGLPELAQRTEALKARVSAISNDIEGQSLDARRAKFLTAQLTAAATRLKMIQGQKLPFDEEAFGLFAVRPQFPPLSSFDPVLARIEKLVPGRGPLAERVEAFSDRFTIPKDRLKPVFDAAIAECRRQTMQHIKLPAPEAFELAFVTGKSWSGYNYYQGNSKSRIEINTDLPIRIDRAVDLGCHEGYPGHHVLNVLLEQHLVRGKGWVEFSVYPLYSPQSLIAEGTANYGIDLAFPGPERLAFETRTLYPLAGVSTTDAQAYAELQDAKSALAGARFTIAREFLEGRIGEAEAVGLIQRYQLVSAERARQSLDFTRQYRSYVINYGLGEDMARADIEAAGSSPQARWARMAELLSQPTLPADLKP